MCRRMRSLWVSQSRSICIQYSVSSRSECMRTAQGSGQLCSTRSSAPRHSASLRRGGSLMPHQGLRCPPHRLCSSILIVLAYGLDKFSCDNGFCTERTVEFPSYCSDQICDQISAIRIQKTGKTLRTSYKNTKNVRSYLRSDCDQSDQIFVQLLRYSDRHGYSSDRSGMMLPRIKPPSDLDRISPHPYVEGVEP